MNIFSLSSQTPPNVTPHLEEIADSSKRQARLAQLSQLYSKQSFTTSWLPLIQRFKDSTDHALFTDLLYCLKNRLQEVVDHFFDFPINVQTHFLMEMQPAERKKIANCTNESHSPLVAEWLARIVYQLPTMKKRQQFCRCFLSEIDLDKVGKLFEHLLNQQELENEIGEQAYAAIPYLLLSILEQESEEELGNTLLGMQTDLQNNIFSKCPIDDLTMEVLEKIQEEETHVQCLISWGQFRISSDALDPSMTMEVALQHVQEMFKNRDKLSDFPHYEQFFSHLPAFLLGLVLLHQKNYSLFLPFVRSLTDKQLTILTKCIPHEEVFRQVEVLLPTLRRDQLKTIEQALTPTQLEVYKEKKTVAFKAECQRFNQRLSQLQQKVMLLENQKGKITESEFTSCASESRRLSLLSQTLEHQYQILAEASYFKTSPTLAITQRLKQLRSRVKEQEKEEESLYLEFQSRLVQREMVHLKIAHAGELSNLGIKTNEDLACLRISQAQQIAVDRVIMAINQLASRKVDPTKLDDQWKKILHLDLKGKGIPFIKEKRNLVKQLKLATSMKLREKGQMLCQRILDLDHLHIVQRQGLLFYRQQFQRSKKIHPVLLKVIHLAVNIVKRRDTLALLQSYLVQPNLREAWEIFHSKDIYYLKDLQEKGLATNPTQLKKLHSIAQSLFKKRKITNSE